VIGVAINETPSRSWIGKPQAADMLQSLPFGAASEHLTPAKKFWFMNRKSGGEKEEEMKFP
jgi:hypothetical protein